MIELNTFGTTASSALFDWNTDKQVMYNGPFEFRVSFSLFYFGFGFVHLSVTS